MENFEDKGSNKRRKDAYAQDVEKIVSVMKDRGIANSKMQENFGIEAGSLEEVRKTLTIKSINSKALIWGTIFIFISSNALSYKLLVKIAKKRLHLTTFWPIHFAIFVPMNILNFTMLGVADGYLKHLEYNDKMSVYRE